MSTKIETLWNTYQAISELIKFADTKATAILAIDGVIISLYFGNMDNIETVLSQNWLTILPLGVALISILISLVFSAYGIVPRLKSDGKCLLFFWDIEHGYSSAAAYNEAIKKTKRKEVEAQISNQIWEISKIASKKYRAVKRSLIFFVLAAIASTGFMVAALSFVFSI